MILLENERDPAPCGSRARLDYKMRNLVPTVV
jgi:hypothetical protein